MWGKAVFVLTHANTLQNTVIDRKSYEIPIRQICTDVKGMLKSEFDASEHVPIITAGDECPKLNYEDNKDWKEHLFLNALRRVRPEMLGTFLEARYKIKDLFEAANGRNTDVPISYGILAAFVEIMSPLWQKILSAQLHEVAGVLKQRFREWHEVSNITAG